LFETALGLFLSHAPGMDTILMTRPVKMVWLSPALPFVVFIVVKTKAFSFFM
jgi:hypothetical protein